jgi:transcriptional regulator with GAF, ATPase, and Fis domain
MLSRHGSVDREAVCAALRQGRPELEALQLTAQLEPSFSSLSRASVAREPAPPSDVGRGDSAPLPFPLPARAEALLKANGPVDLNEIQRQITIEAFDQHDRNLARAARHLSIPRTTLRGRLRRYGVL